MNTIRVTLETKWFLSIKLSTLFEKYSELDYGIGIDWGEVFIVRVEISRDTNNNDLVFIGKCENFAIAIANQAKAPENVEVSFPVYNNLEDNLKYHTKNNNKVNMWNDGKVVWNNKSYDTKLTSYYWRL